MGRRDMMLSSADNITILRRPPCKVPLRSRADEGEARGVVNEVGLGRIWQLDSTR